MASRTKALSVVLGAAAAIVAVWAASEWLERLRSARAVPHLIEVLRREAPEPEETSFTPGPWLWTPTGQIEDTIVTTPIEPTEHGSGPVVRHRFYRVHTAAEALVAIGPPAVEPLISALEEVEEGPDTASERRFSLQAIWALGEIGAADPDAADTIAGYLRPMLEDVWEEYQTARWAWSKLPRGRVAGCP